MMRHNDVLSLLPVRPWVLWARRLAWVGLVLLVAGSLVSGVGRAQGDVVADLPITRVVLFSSGVGYFEHTGTVNGDQDFVLDVPDAQMDDLLQSLVVQDFGGGTVRPVRYPTRDPLARILAGYALDLSGNPSLASLLVQARGEVVEIDAGETLRGAIVSVEQRTTSEGPATDLTLATDTGLRRVPLTEVLSLRFEDPEIRAAFDAALAAIAEHRSDDTRSVRLRFEGEGTREVRIGYVREMPVWKTSYRLVLDVDPDAPERAELQGWAIVDNPTDQPLENVEMAFVAGRPLAFVTSLYDPVYVDRPRVEIETSVVAPPDADTGALAPMARMAPAAADALFEAEVAGAAAPSFAGGGVEAMAQGVAAGPTFSYVVDGPVSVDRHASAMIPILRTSVPATTVAWYDAGADTGVALRATEIENATELHLAAGTVTVFGAQGFLGNARLAETLPGERRLLGYALDPAVDVAFDRASDPERVTAVRLVGASLESTIRQRWRTTYTVRASGVGAAVTTLWLDHPTIDGFDVVAPDPDPARTADGVRIGVALGEDADATRDPAVPVQFRCGAGTACDFDVVEERLESRRIAVANLAGDQIAFYLENVELSSADRAVLERVLELQRELARLDRQIADIDRQIRAIVDEQSRIRQNMAALDRDSSLYRRYVRDLETQEDELDTLQASQTELRDTRSGVQTDLDAVIAGLTPSE